MNFSIELIVDLLSWAFLLFGSFLVLTSALGLFRLPDFYTRMHAAGITDTLAGGLILTGLMLQSDWEWLVLVKLITIILFLGITSPTASHALAKAALHSGLKPAMNSNNKK